MIVAFLHASVYRKRSNKPLLLLLLYQVMMQLRSQSHWGSNGVVAHHKTLVRRVREIDVINIDMRVF